MDQQQMAAYLKACRGRISPSSKGFSDVRRRVPGLRREEVAELAGISADWYTRLEQGRGTGVSRDVLNRLAEALELSPFESEYLASLSGNARMTNWVSDSANSKAERILRHEMLTALLPHPAYYVMGPWQVIAWNEAVDLVLPELFDKQSKCNAMRMIFCNDSYRARIKNWSKSARESLTVFRGDYGLRPAGERFQGLVAELMTESAEFAQWWSEHEVSTRGPERKVLIDEKLGNLHFVTQCYISAKQPDLILVVFTGDVTTQHKITEALQR